MLRVLRRLLAVALLLVVASIALPFVWHIFADVLELTPGTALGRQSDPGPWTWQCEPSGRCTRRVRGDEPAVSLDTCQWTCSVGGVPLWPRPTGMLQLANSSVLLDPAPSRVRLQIRVPAPRPPDAPHRDTVKLLQQAVRRLVSQLQQLRPPRGAAAAYYRAPADVTQLRVIVELDRASSSYPPGYLSLHTDEGYELQVRLQGPWLVATVRARSFFGARHGLETLAQLAWWDSVAEGVRMLSSVDIHDAPRFAYRGVMVDTARNFIPLKALMRTVDAMAANKLNALHWHLTDSNSFPYLSPALPDMARLGAYSPQQVYSLEDVSDLTEYARVRGVRVLVELDVPAHASEGWPAELVSCLSGEPAVNGPPQQQQVQWWSLCGQPPCGQLHPTKKDTFNILRQLYKELLTATRTTDMAHLGGDEVSPACWRQLTGNVLNHYTDLWGNFMKRAHRELVAARGGKAPSATVVWSSELTKPQFISRYYKPETHVVQVWGGSKWNETVPMLYAGFRTILSHVDAWYLDCGFGDFRSAGPGACGPVATWQTVYSHRPWAAYPPALRHGVLGGEACLWTEKVDEQSLDVRLWPRCSALAERLWSDPLPADGQAAAASSGSGPGPPLDEPNLKAAYQRLSHHRERLVARGVGADPLWPRWCHLNPGACF